MRKKVDPVMAQFQANLKDLPVGQWTPKNIEARMPPALRKVKQTYRLTLNSTSSEGNPVESEWFFTMNYDEKDLLLAKVQTLLDLGKITGFNLNNEVLLRPEFMDSLAKVLMAGDGK